MFFKNFFNSLINISSLQITFRFGILHFDTVLNSSRQMCADVGECSLPTSTGRKSASDLFAFSPNAKLISSSACLSTNSAPRLSPPEVETDCSHKFHSYLFYIFNFIFGVYFEHILICVCPAPPHMRR